MNIQQMIIVKCRTFWMVMRYDIVKKYKRFGKKIINDMILHFLNNFENWFNRKIGWFFMNGYKGKSE